MNESPPNDVLKSVWQNQKTEGIRMSADDLRRKAKQFHGKILWRNLREYLAVLAVAALFGFEFWRTTDVLARAGFALTIAGMLYLVWQLYRKGSSRALPAEMGLASGLEFFKRELERQRDLLQNVGKWYLGPLVPGLAIITIASARSNPGHLRHFALFLALYSLIVAFIFVSIWKFNRRAARKLQRQIEELDALKEPR